MTNYPKDYNREARRKPEPVDLTVWPKDLRWAYWVFVAAAVVMAASGLVGFFGQNQEATGEFAEFLKANRHFVSAVNLGGAVIIALIAPQLSRAMKHGRSILAAVVGLGSFCNVAAIAIGAGGLLLVLIVALLVTATYLMYRPAPNEFVRERNRPRL